MSRQPLSGDVHELVDAARTGDPVAQGALFDRYYGAVYRYAFTRLGSVPDAEDAAVDTFVSAIGALSRFRWRDVPFEAWLFRIAASRVSDGLRRRRRRPEQALTTDPAATLAGDGDPVEHALRADRVALLAAAVDALPPAQRDVLVLRFYLDRPIRDVARTLGRTEGAVKQLQLRALARLRSELDR